MGEKEEETKKEPKEETKFAKIYDNSGYPTMGLRVKGAREYIGGYAATVPCVNGGWHLWLKTPNEPIPPCDCDPKKKEDRKSWAF